MHFSLKKTWFAKMSPKSPFFSLASVNELALDPWFSALFLVMLTIITEAEYKLEREYRE